ncbi:hypothetical protein GCM10011380_31080 [Sphingomonas metalli]|uniref:Uncharacterized protein n=1 Tax=Sphingomonas metalli TaxID=1779358 RepID=A0A916WX58_9SPHN|nr:hypothetical protein [Sphingomonas metalli]GGB39371.1 hypothetical protein GCM10011380_31080 [Sphingomonas metalli]
MRRRIVPLGLLALWLPGPATGQEVAAAGFEASALTETDLGAIAGREDHGTQIAQADQRNTVQNNSVTGNSTTGTVTIDGQAFQNLSGLAVISANSGNNVAINSAMNVVINLAPPQ